MTPHEPEVLASRWRLDDLLAGSREVEVHTATDTELGTEVVAVLWSEDPGSSGREVDAVDVDLVDCGMHDGVWFATYARLDGVPLAPAAKATLARSFVPDGDLTSPIPTQREAEHAEEVPASPTGPRRRGLAVAGLVGLLVLLAAGGLLVGRSKDGDAGSGAVAPRSEELAEEPLRGAMRELREAAGAEARPAVAVVEDAVGRRDWPAAEQALARVRRFDGGGTDGRPGRLGLAVDRVRAALPTARPGGEGAPTPTPCEAPTTTSTSGLPESTSSTTSTTSTTVATSTTAATPTTSTTTPCAPTTTTTDVGRPTSTTNVPSSSPSSTSSTTTTSTSSTTSVPTTTSSTSSTSTTTTTTP